jgi:hypothetical protein
MYTGAMSQKSVPTKHCDYFDGHRTECVDEDTVVARPVQPTPYFATRLTLQREGQAHELAMSREETKRREITAKEETKRNMLLEMIRRGRITNVTDLMKALE